MITTGMSRIELARAVLDEKLSREAAGEILIERAIVRLRRLEWKAKEAEERSERADARSRRQARRPKEVPE